ncbi:hypothetical protein C6C15_14440 [Microbacterium sp. str. 'China']|nr:hypothetical protein C6C15_14440 [Microbacterium sp. str. 'China']
MRRRRSTSRRGTPACTARGLRGRRGGATWPSCCRPRPTRRRSGPSRRPGPCPSRPQLTAALDARR